MRKKITLILKIAIGIVVALIVLTAGAFGLLHTSSVQNWLTGQATDLLQDKLQTKVTIEKVRINLFGQDVQLQGVELEDQQQRKMLQIEDLGVELELWQLLNNTVKVKEAHIDGMTALLLKPSPDSVANYQFVIDAFKKEPKTEEEEAGKKEKRKLAFDISRLRLQRINVTYNEHQFELGSVVYNKHWNGKESVELKEAKMAWVRQTKKGPVDTRLRLGILNFKKSESEQLLSADSLCLVTDNHKPRRNSGRPKRGAFDVGHLNVVAKLSARLEHVGKDGLTAVITECKVTDRGSGLSANELLCKVRANKQKLQLDDVTVRMANTKLTFAHADIQLPNKKEDRKLTYSTSLIQGTTLLKDIAQPFAPVLANFSIPLNLQTQMSGDDNGMRFSDVQVSTIGKQFNVKAKGYISNLKDKYKLNVHFDVLQMSANSGVKERIISQFPVKKFMMKQLHNLGRISYTGWFDVLWKKESFAGLLWTAVGKIQFNFALDEANKYVFGSAQTDSLELGKAMDMPDLGKIACKANFKFDISKPRTALMRRQKGGKLPIGHVDADIPEAKYKFVKVRNIHAEINSDGAVAEGSVVSKGKLVDLLCSFSFTNTNEMKKTKIKPGMRLHQKTDEEKAAKEALKQQKADDKAARKQQKADEKAARKAEKDMQKAAKAEEKAARKAEKEMQKAAKAEEKAARKAAKAAEKQRKKEGKTEEI